MDFCVSEKCSYSEMLHSALLIEALSPVLLTRNFMDGIDMVFIYSRIDH